MSSSNKEGLEKGLDTAKSLLKDDSHTEGYDDQDEEGPDHVPTEPEEENGVHDEEQVPDHGEESPEEESHESPEEEEASEHDESHPDHPTNLKKQIAALKMELHGIKRSREY